MNKAYILLGGNVGDTKAHLQTANSLLNQYCGDIVQRSSVYVTEPWGKIDQRYFLNQAIGIDTPMSALNLMQQILEVEVMMGRLRTEKYGSRIIDIDLLFFNDLIFDNPHLTIPHPQLQNRRFALIPLSEIASDKIHPVLQKTVSELLKTCTDQLQVSLFE